MLSQMLRRVLPRVAPHGRQFSAPSAPDATPGTAARCPAWQAIFCPAWQAIFHELIQGEADPVRLSKLHLLQSVWEEQVKAREREVMLADRALLGAQNAYLDAKFARDREILQAQHAREAAQLTQALLEQRVTSATLDYLRAAGLNNACGLFEYLQGKILTRDPATSGQKGSEAVWATVLANDKKLAACLRNHLEANTNLASYLAGIYQSLSHHVRSGKPLTVSGGTIVFECDFLTTQQCSSIVCLGAAVGLSVKPAPRTTNLRYE